MHILDTPWTEPQAASGTDVAISRFPRKATIALASGTPLVSYAARGRHSNNEAKPERIFEPNWLKKQQNNMRELINLRKP